MKIRYIYTIIFLVGILILIACNKISKTPATPIINVEDSLLIAAKILPTTTNIEATYDTVLAQLQDSATSMPMLQLNYAKALIMTGKLPAADKYIHAIFQAQMYDSNQIQIAKLYNLLAAIQAYQQNQENAIQYYKNALEIFESHHDTKNAAIVNFNIANIFFSRLNYALAASYSEAAANNFESVHDTMHYSKALSIHAVSLIMLGQETAATLQASKAHEIAANSNDPVASALSTYAMAEIDLYKKDYAAAIHKFKAVIPLAEASKQITILLAAYTSLSKAYLLNKAYPISIETGHIALEVAQKYNYKDVSYALYKNMAAAYQAMGNTKAALQYMNNADELFRAELVDNDRQVLNELLIQYQAEKKDKLLAEQALEIQERKALLKLWLIIGSMVILVAILSILLIRNAQRHKLKLIQQANENALMKAMMEGEERERNRISKSLHDGVASYVGAAKMSLEALPHLPQQAQAQQLTAITQSLGKTHQEIRRIAHDLMPMSLKLNNLTDAVQQYVEEMDELGILHIRFEKNIQGLLTLDTQTNIILFRIIQELVNNIIQHAQAQHATVYIESNTSKLFIKVTDDGKGYAAAQAGHGIMSIQERINLIGGHFHIATSEVDGSTIATISLSLT